VEVGVGLLKGRLHELRVDHQPLDIIDLAVLVGVSLGKALI
jgi:hypothetical protein